MRIVWWQLSELLRKWAGACCPDERWLLLLYTLLLSRHINVASVASNSFHWTAAPMHNVLLVQYLFLAVVCRQFYSIPNNFCLRDKGKAFSNCYYWPVLQLPGGGAQQWSIRDIKAHQRSHKLLISGSGARGEQTIRRVGLNNPLWNISTPKKTRATTGLLI